MPGGISSGAGSVPSSAGTAARAGSALLAQLVTHTRAVTPPVVGQGSGSVQSMLCTCRVSAASLPSLRYNSSSPCFLQEQGQEEQKTHLGAKHYREFGSVQQASGKSIPWHSAALSCAGRETGRFQRTSLTIPESLAEPQVWKLEGTFDHSGCCSCSFGAFFTGRGSTKCQFPPSAAPPETHMLISSTSLALKEHLTPPNLKPKPLKIL